jgi:hypothetical protein
VSLLLTRPGLPKCEDCCEWVFDFGEMRWGDYPHGSGKRVRRHGPPPCGTCPKIPEGETPCPGVGQQSELTPENRMAYQHFSECDAVGEFPRDGRVRRNAAIIRHIKDAAAAGRDLDLTNAIASVAAVAKRD